MLHLMTERILSGLCSNPLSHEKNTNWFVPFFAQGYSAFDFALFHSMASRSYHLRHRNISNIIMSSH